MVSASPSTQERGASKVSDECKLRED